MPQDQRSASRIELLKRAGRDGSRPFLALTAAFLRLSDGRGAASPLQDESGLVRSLKPSLRPSQTLPGAP